MKKPIEYFYSAYSAYAYIGHLDFLELASDAEREVIHRPFDLMKCLNAIGYHPLEERTDEALSYQFGRQRDRWSEFRNVPMPKETPSSHNNGAEIADLVLLASIKNGEDIQKLSSEFMKRHWLKNLDLSDEQAVHNTLIDLGLEASTLIMEAKSQSILKEYATGQKPTMKELVQNIKRKDKAKRITEDPEAQNDAVIRRQGDYDPSYDDYASGGIARMLGE